MIQQIKNSVGADPWPWIFRFIMTLLMISIGVIGFFAKETLADIKGTADATLDRIDGLNARVYDNTRRIDGAETKISIQDKRIDSLDTRVQRLEYRPDWSPR